MPLLAITAFTLAASSGPGRSRWTTGTVCGCDHPPLVKSVAKMVLPSDAYRGGTKRSYAIAAIDVDRSGHAVRIHLIEDTGNAVLDSAIVTALERSAYIPARHHCAPDTGRLILHVQSLPKTVIKNPCDHPPLKIATTLPAFPMETLPRHPIDVPVRVSVNRFGAAISAHVTKTSGWKNLDELEAKMATNSSYLPAVRHCIPVDEAHTFIFRWMR